MLYTVYMHTTPDGKRYVGMTCQQLSKRWRGGRGYSNTSYFYRAILKYGWDNIKHEVLEEGLTLEEAAQREQYYIELYKTQDRKHGYNICNGGQTGWAGLKHSEESKQKMSIAKRGKNYGRVGFHLSDDVKKKLSDSHKGKYHGQPVKPKVKGEPVINGKRQFTLEHRQKISEALVGIQRSDEVRKNMSKAQTKTKRKVLCLNNGKVYESMTEAAKELGTSKTMIYRVCRGINQTANGYEFAYVKDGNHE